MDPKQAGFCNDPPKPYPSSHPSPSTLPRPTPFNPRQFLPNYPSNNVAQHYTSVHDYDSQPSSLRFIFSKTPSQDDQEHYNTSSNQKRKSRFLQIVIITIQCLFARIILCIPVKILFRGPEYRIWNVVLPDALNPLLWILLRIGRMSLFTGTCHCEWMWD